MSEFHQLMDPASLSVLQELGGMDNREYEQFWSERGQAVYIADHNNVDHHGAAEHRNENANADISGRNQTGRTTEFGHDSETDRRIEIDLSDALQRHLETQHHDDLEIPNEAGDLMMQRDEEREASASTDTNVDKEAALFANISQQGVSAYEENVPKGLSMQFKEERSNSNSPPHAHPTSLNVAGSVDMVNQNATAYRPQEIYSGISAEGIIHGTDTWHGLTQLPSWDEHYLNSDDVDSAQLPGEPPLYTALTASTVNPTVVQNNGAAEAAESTSAHTHDMPIDTIQGQSRNLQTREDPIHSSIETDDGSTLEISEGPAITDSPQEEITLKFKSVAEANNWRSTPLEMLPPDPTIPQTSEEEVRYMKLLMKAFLSMEHAQDNQSMLGRFQNQAYDLAKVEIVCWNVLACCVSRHKFGPLDAEDKSKSTKAKSQITTFAQRMEHIIHALETQKSIARHLLEDQYLFGFVNDPIEHKGRVVSNRKLNGKKSQVLAAGAKYNKLVAEGEIPVNGEDQATPLNQSSQPKQPARRARAKRARQSSTQATIITPPDSRASSQASGSQMKPQGQIMAAAPQLSTPNRPAQTIVDSMRTPMSHHPSVVLAAELGSQTYPSEPAIDTNNIHAPAHHYGVANGPYPYVLNQYAGNGQLPTPFHQRTGSNGFNGFSNGSFSLARAPQPMMPTPMANTPIDHNLMNAALSEGARMVNSAQMMNASQMLRMATSSSFPPPAAPQSYTPTPAGNARGRKRSSTDAQSAQQFAPPAQKRPRH
ncbi:hypothetical protein AJ80_04943 [Polytolypa hystricis UAMH7299]|uniref:Uncharacterized protein n=1 Tax=Polytolypa hystricis (strain UAMH7299) TaxID=1447883 RepID=A0A2B7Y787_POLH7|nr:hypothetical protein AJ80_04943 [Polytolypa hystricis UAMH7299]